MTLWKTTLAVILFLTIAAVVVFNIGSSPRSNAKPQVSIPVPTVSPPPKPLTEAEKLQRRKAFINIWERAMLAKGLDFYFSLKGKKQDELEAKYVLMSRPFVYQFQHEYSDLIAQMGDLGFTKIILTDGYDDRWVIDVP